MKDVNKVILLGRLGANPIQRETQTGVRVANFPLATSRKFKKEDEDGASETKEETQWHHIVAWGKQGEHCAQYLKKGQKVFIEGSIRTRKYAAKNGEERLAVEVHAENVSFLDSRASSEKPTVN